MFKASAILLAAGLSRRMGAQNKLLLPVHGVPLVRYVVDTDTSAIDGPVLVVLGHQAEHVAAALAGSSAERVFNPHYADGQLTSVSTDSVFLLNENKKYTSGTFFLKPIFEIPRR